MSVLIKGMEMPTGNDELRLIIHPNGQVIISHKTYYEETEAVFVPPHGRLIDADALLQRAISHGWSTPKWVSNIVIEDAPTIIPAEESK